MNLSTKKGVRTLSRSKNEAERLRAALAVAEDYAHCGAGVKAVSEPANAALAALEKLLDLGDEIDLNSLLTTAELFGTGTPTPASKSA